MEQQRINPMNEQEQLSAQTTEEVSTASATVTEHTAVDMHDSMPIGPAGAVAAVSEVQAETKLIVKDAGAPTEIRYRQVADGSTSAPSAEDFDTPLDQIAPENVFFPVQNPAGEEAAAEDATYAMPVPSGALGAMLDQIYMAVEYAGDEVKDNVRALVRRTREMI
jgi:hypothetical protein